MAKINNAKISFRRIRREVEDRSDSLNGQIAGAAGMALVDDLFGINENTSKEELLRLALTAAHALAFLRTWYLPRKTREEFDKSVSKSIRNANKALRKETKATLKNLTTSPHNIKLAKLGKRGWIIRCMDETHRYLGYDVIGGDFFIDNITRFARKKDAKRFIKVLDAYGEGKFPSVLRAERGR